MKIERAEFSGRLISLLDKAGVGNFGDLECDDAEWARMRAHARRQHPEEDEQQIIERTWFRVATLKMIPRASQGAQPSAIIDAQNREISNIHAHLRELTAAHEHLPEIERRAISQAGQLDGLHTLIELNHEDLSAKLKQTASAAVTVLKDGQKAVQNEVLRLLSAEHEESRREAEEARRARRNDKRAAALWLCLLTLAFLVMLFWPHRAQGQIVPTNTAYIGGVAVDPLTYDTTNKAIKVNVVAGGAGGGVAQLQVGRTADGLFTNVGYFAGQLNVPVNCVVGCAGGSTTPGDSFANPTTAGITVVFPAVWNGATWDRLYGDKTNGAFVNVKVLPALSLAASTAVIGHVIADSGSTTAVTGNVASTVADGADVTLGAKADAKSTATDTTPISLVSILKQISASVQAPPSQAVTNANLDVALSTLGTAANQVTGNNLLSSLDTKTPTVGQKLMSGSSPVVLPSDQTVSISIPANTYTNNRPLGTESAPVIREADSYFQLAALKAISDAIVKTSFPHDGLGNVKPIPVSLPAATDPCGQRKGGVAISQTATTKLLSGTPGMLIAVCYARVIAGAAEIPSFWEGTGTACATGTLAVSGSATTANGESYAINGGFSGGVGLGTIMVTSKPGNDLCLAQNGSARLAGNLTYVYFAP